MATPLYLDVHIPLAIARQLMRRGVDVVHAVEERTDRMRDDQLLELAREQRRLMVTQDILFRVMAEDWQRRGKEFAGLCFGRQQGAIIGDYVADLELISKASDIAEWANCIQHLPL